MLDSSAWERGCGRAERRRRWWSWVRVIVGVGDWGVVGVELMGREVVSVSMVLKEVLVSSVAVSVAGEEEEVEVEVLLSGRSSVAVAVSLDGGSKDRTDQVGLERSSLVSTQAKGFLKTWSRALGLLYFGFMGLSSFSIL
jgi:hypothetical protein